MSKLAQVDSLVAATAIATSIVASGLVILGLLVVDLSDLHQRLQLSAIALAAGSVLAVPLAAQLARRRLIVTAMAGLGFSGGAAVLLAMVPWLSSEASWFDQASWSFLILAAALSVSCLPALQDLAPGFRWVRVSLWGTVALLASLALVALWLEPTPPPFGRLVASVGLLAALLLLFALVLPRSARAG